MNVRAALLFIALGTIASIAPAAAHVTVAPKTLPAGAVDELTFRAPNERSNSGTVKIEIQLPPDHPFRFLTARPVPGWHVHVTKQTVTWDGGTIHPGEYQDFALLAGPMPAAGTVLVFKALQTYASGEIVRWIELRHPGAPEPRNPAPVLTIR